jgi:hypothetical protein
MEKMILDFIAAYPIPAGIATLLLLMALDRLLTGRFGA